jgi:AraC family transcriptional regulator
MAQELSLQRAWTCPNGLGATLTHYPAAGRHFLHFHDHLQVSFVLAGWLSEELEGREHVAGGLSRGHKPAGARHSDAWGDEGVLVFTLRLGESLAAAAGLDAEPGWTSLSGPGDVGALVRSFAEGGDPAAREEAAMDLLACDREAEPVRAEPPLWLRRARDAIHDAPEALGIDQAAREAGVHRAHLSRLFRRHYGVPPSVYRRRLLLCRAAAALVRSEAPLAQVAAEAGFCDQSHLSRAMRADTGLTPALARRLLRKATFIQ